MKKLMDHFFSEEFKSSFAYQHIAPLLQDKLNGVESILDVEEDYVYSSPSLAICHNVDEQGAHLYEIELPEKLVHYRICLSKYSYEERFSFVTVSSFPLEVENKVEIVYNKVNSNQQSCEVDYGESSVEYIDKVGGKVQSYHQTVYTKKGDIKKEQHRNLSQARMILEALKAYSEYEHNVDSKNIETRFDKTYKSELLDKIVVTKKEEKQKIKVAPFKTSPIRKF